MIGRCLWFLGAFYSGMTVSFAGVKAPPVTDFAIIFQGTPEIAASNSTRLAQEALLSSGIPKDNIIMAGPFVQTKNESIEDFRNRVGLELSKAISKPELKRLNEQSHLILYFAGHGYNFVDDKSKPVAGIAFTTSKKNTSDVKLSYEDFGRAVSKIAPSSKKTMIVDACYSGNCIEALKSENTTVITSSDSTNPAKWLPMHGSQTYWVFSYHFFSALKGEYPTGQVIQADSNCDGKVDFDEAFVFSARQKNLGLPGPEGVVPVLGFERGSSPPSNPQISRPEPKKCTVVKPATEELPKMQLIEEPIRNGVHDSSPPKR
jgi:hypothetical protein